MSISNANAFGWQRLADVKPNTGQLVEYRGVNPECARKSYSAIGTVPKKGHFIKDCGTHWTENLNGFTTEKLGVIVAPDPDITFWRALAGAKYSLRAGGEILNSEVPIPFASCGCPCCERALLALTFRTPS